MKALQRPAREVSLTGIPNIGKATVSGGVLGALFVAIPVAVGLLLSGGGPTSILFAAHVGFFGGMGYGGMLGAVIEADRSDQRGGSHHDRDTSREREATRRAA